MHTYREFDEAEQDPNLGGNVISSEAERRAWARFRTDDAARMKVLDPLGAKTAEVRVLDVSHGGLKLRVPSYLQPGTIVQVNLKSAVVFAEVRYCVGAQIGFHAGVQFQNVVWDQRIDASV